MRVAQVCPYSLSEHGGVQAQVFGLSRALRALGHDVTVVGPSDSPPGPEAGAGADLVSTGPTIPVEANGSLAPISFDAGASVRMLRLLHARRFDVLHLHEPLVPGPTMAALIAAAAPMVGTFHLSGPSASYDYFRPLVRRWARRLAVRVCVSDDARVTAEATLGGSYTVLFNGVEVERFAAARGRCGAGGLPRAGLSDAEVPVVPPAGGGDTGKAVRPATIVFVGRHDERKGLAVLLQAFSRLRTSGAGRAGAAVLLIAGEGPETAALRERWASSAGVTWLGRLSDEAVVELVASADVLCAPSLGGESFGIVLVEAMAAGTPVVASDLTGYRSVAGDGAAVLVAPGDPVALASAVDEVLSDPARAARLVEVGTSRAKRYSMDRLAREYEAIYAQILT